MSDARLIPLLLFLSLFLGAVNANAQAQPKEAAAKQPPLVAVTPFETHSGKDDELGGLIADKIATAAVNSGDFRVVERSRISYILEEANFGDSKLGTGDTTEQIRELAGADMVIAGSAAQLGGQITIEARLIDASDGRVIAAADAVADRTHQGLVNAARTIVAKLSGKPAPSPPPPSPPQVAGTGAVPAAPEAAAAVKPAMGTAPPRPAGGSGADVLMSMLDATLASQFNRTLALSRNVPLPNAGATDRNQAKALSKKANGLINKEKNVPAAIATYAQAYALDPTSSEIAGSYGYSLFRGGDFENARDVEMASLVLKPNYGAAWFVLGEIFSCLGQEEYAYASYVNTCLFSNNIKTSLRFIEKERIGKGEGCPTAAAGKAIEVCQNLAGGTGQDAPAPYAPSPAPQATTPSPATTSAPAPTAQPGKPERIGSVNVIKAIMTSPKFGAFFTEIANRPNLSEQEREAMLQQVAAPIFEDVREAAGAYARANGYKLILPMKEVAPFRQGVRVPNSYFVLSGVDETYRTFLNSDQGKGFRKTAPIDDLTDAVSQKLK